MNDPLLQRSPLSPSEELSPLRELANEKIEEVLLGTNREILNIAVKYLQESVTETPSIDSLAERISHHPKISPEIKEAWVTFSESLAHPKLEEISEEQIPQFENVLREALLNQALTLLGEKSGVFTVNKYSWALGALSLPNAIAIPNPLPDVVGTAENPGELSTLMQASFEKLKSGKTGKDLEEVLSWELAWKDMENHIRENSQKTLFSHDPEVRKNEYHSLAWIFHQSVNGEKSEEDLKILFSLLPEFVPTCKTGWEQRIIEQAYPFGTGKAAPVTTLRDLITKLSLIQRRDAVQAFFQKNDILAQQGFNVVGKASNVHYVGAIKQALNKDFCLGYSAAELGGREAYTQFIEEAMNNKKIFADILKFVIDKCSPEITLKILTDTLNDLPPSVLIEKLEPLFQVYKSRIKEKGTLFISPAEKARVEEVFDKLTEKFHAIQLIQDVKDKTAAILELRAYAEDHGIGMPLWHDIVESDINAIKGRMQVELGLLLRKSTYTIEEYLTIAKEKLSKLSHELNELSRKEVDQVSEEDMERITQLKQRQERIPKLIQELENMQKKHEDLKSKPEEAFKQAIEKGYLPSDEQIQSEIAKVSEVIITKDLDKFKGMFFTTEQVNKKSVQKLTPLAVELIAAFYGMVHFPVGEAKSKAQQLVMMMQNLAPLTFEEIEVIRDFSTSAFGWVPAIRGLVDIIKNMPQEQHKGIFDLFAIQAFTEEFVEGLLQGPNGLKAMELVKMKPELLGFSQVAASLALQIKEDPSLIVDIPDQALTGHFLRLIQEDPDGLTAVGLVTVAGLKPHLLSFPEITNNIVLAIKNDLSLLNNLGDDSITRIREKLLPPNPTPKDWEIYASYAKIKPLIFLNSLQDDAFTDSFLRLLQEEPNGIAPKDLVIIKPTLFFKFPQFANDRELLLFVYKKNPQIAKEMYPKDSLKEIKFVRSCLEVDPYILNHLPKTFLHELSSEIKSRLEYARHTADDWITSKKLALYLVTRLDLSPRLKTLSDELRNDKEVVLAYIKNSSHNLEHASENLKKDRQVVLAAARRYYDPEPFLTEELKNDENFRLILRVGLNPKIAKTISDKLLKDKAFVLELVTANGEALKYVSKELRGNMEVVLAAVKSNPKALKYASKELRDNTMVALTAISLEPYSCQYVSNRLKDDEYFIYEAVKIDDICFKFASNRLKDNEPFILKCATMDKKTFEDFSRSSFRNNSFGVFESISDRLKGDPKFMLKSMEISRGEAFKSASNRLKDNEEFILKAIKTLKTVSFLYNISDRIKDDEVFFLKAMHIYEHGDIISFASERLRDNKEFVLRAIRKGHGFGSWLSDKLKNDKELVLEAIRAPGDMSDVGYKLLHDNEIQEAFRNRPRNL